MVVLNFKLLRALIVCASANSNHSHWYFGSSILKRCYCEFWWMLRPWVKSVFLIWWYLKRFFSIIGSIWGRKWLANEFANFERYIEFLCLMYWRSSLFLELAAEVHYAYSICKELLSVGLYALQRYPYYILII